MIRTEIPLGINGLNVLFTILRQFGFLACLNGPARELSDLIGEQHMLRYAHAHQSLHCSHAHIMDIDEDSEPHLDL